jgi:hypothetical protein
MSNVDSIRSTNFWVGSPRPGRPPQCWESFNTMLNITENKYPNMSQSVEGLKVQGRHYLYLLVEKGKRERHELE